MKTTIFYASKYGFTKQCVDYLAQHLSGQVSLVNLKETDQDYDDILKQSDQIIIGGSVYVGSVQKEVQDLLSDHQQTLLQKKIGIFLCGMREQNEIDQEINANFPKELRDHAQFVSWFGGEFDFKKLSWIDKAIVKKIAKVKETTTLFHQDELDRIINMMNQRV